MICKILDVTEYKLFECSFFVMNDLNKYKAIICSQIYVSATVIMLYLWITFCFCFILTANSNYELGTGDKVGGWQPKLISSLEDVRLVQIACGGYHSLALTG